MLSKRLVAVAAMFLLVAGGIFAADFSAYGFTQNATRNVDGIDYLVLVDPSGGEVLLSPVVEPTPDRLDALKSIVAMLRSWNGLTLASIRATNDASQLRVTAIPSSLLSGTTDLMSALPGGLVFWYDKSIEYDFRVLSGPFAIRMAGLFTTPADLLDSLSLAYKDPATWLLKSDPEYAVKQIVQLGARVDGLAAELKADEATIATDGDELTSLASAKTQSDKAAGATIVRLETALMTALNVGFLSGPKPIPPAAVEWVVAKKTADPTLTKAALVEAAKTEKIQVSDKEIGIVLLVKYGEN